MKPKSNMRINSYILIFLFAKIKIFKSSTSQEFFFNTATGKINLV